MGLVKLMLQRNVRLYSMKHTFLAIHLLEEKAKENHSRFAPYFNILPREFPTFPVNFSEEELKELQSSYLAFLVSQRL